MEDADVVNLAQKQLLSIQAFLTDWHVRVTWIAFITLWTLWALTWFVRNIFGGDGQVVQSHEGINSGSIAPGETYTDPQTGQIVEARKPLFAAPSWSVNVFVSCHLCIFMCSKTKSIIEPIKSWA
jgi:hypothetical protein